MGVRSRIASGLTRAARALTPGDPEPVAKTFGSAVPPAIEAAEERAQMTPASPFSPGEPIGPYDGYSRTPRATPYVPQFNVATRPRTHERVSFETLRGLVESYDVAQICCIPGTEIITKRGLVPIEDVVIGDEVITHLGRWRHVTQTMANRPHTSVRTLKTSGFEDLSVTGNHPVYAVDYWVSQTRSRKARGIGWVSADRLRPRGPLVSHSYDGLVLPALDLPDGCPELDVAAVVSDGYVTDADGMLVRRLGGRLTRIPARVRMDAALGRLLGWYMAEGSIGKGRDVHFSLGPNESEYCEQILVDAEAAFGLEGVIRWNSSGTGWCVRISSALLASLFACGNAVNKRLPEWAWAGGREFFAAVLEGWMLGDGCRTQRGDWAPRIEVATSSRDLAWQMRMVAISLGLGASIVTMRNRDKYNAVINGKRLNVQPIAYHVAWTEKPRRWTRESFEFDGRYLATALVSAGPSDYDGPVYNLEVEEDESYVTTGGTVHNCINHRIDSIRSLDHKLVAADHFDGDASEYIDTGMRALEKPDRVHYFETWLGKWLWDELAYGCGTLYRLRNRGGRCIGLLPVDGMTIAPLMDYWGLPPGALEQGTIPDADLPPSHVQYVNGLPWNWLTRADLIYEPYRMHNNSPYGRAPIESIVLTANTDIRFQLYFLQRFTDGNLPSAFASAPETWTPDQIEQFQEYWDGFMYGDQSRKHQIRWIPGGSSFAWSDEKDFTDTFSLFLMRKCCAAFHVVPSDIGFTENVNRSSGESQADVQHRVGDLPFIRYIQRIITGFLQDDLRLPLKFMFDLGEEQDDRAEQANADKIYVDMGAVGVSELREMRYGLTDPVPVPRYIMTSRGGPVPINSLMAVAGEIDPATALPAEGTGLPRKVFGGVEGVLPNPPIRVMSLAEQEFGESAMPPAPPPQPKMQPSDVGLPALPAAPVAKEGDGAPAAGITADTGIYGYDLIEGEDEDEDEEDETGDRAVAVVKELGVFRRYSRARRKAGEWRDFRFAAVDTVTAHRLNDAGRLAVRKAAGEIAVAGLAVLAADTGRVLMLQRALCDGDPAAGKWEVPGGHLEADESPLAAAWREWSEECGVAPPPGVQTGSWRSGIYQGIVWTCERESMVPVRCETAISNPDDPDGDQVEAIAWWDPAQLAGNPAVRPELQESLPDVLAALGISEPAEGDTGTCPCGTPVVYDEMNGWQHADGSISHDDGESVSDKMAAVAKAAKAGKQGSPKRRDWPGWKLDLQTAAYWGPLVTAAAQKALPKSELRDLAAAYIAAHPGQDGDAPGKRDRNAAAAAWLASRGVTVPMGDVGQGIVTDGYMIGAASARAMVQGQQHADTSGWQPGDGGKARELVEALGAASLLAAVLGGGGSGTPAAGAGQDMGDGYIAVVARVLAGWDPDVAVGELADMLGEAVADGAYAEALTVTQITTYSGQAALDYYLANTDSMCRWVAVIDSRTCPVCLENAAADARKAGEPWPSGDVAPPAHPGGCRCALVPDWA